MLKWLKQCTGSEFSMYSHQQACGLWSVGTTIQWSAPALKPDEMKDIHDGYRTVLPRKSLSIYGDDKHSLFSILVTIIFRHMDGQSDLGLGKFEVRGHLTHTLSEQLLLGGQCHQGLLVQWEGWCVWSARCLGRFLSTGNYMNTRIREFPAEYCTVGRCLKF